MYNIICVTNRHLCGERDFLSQIQKIAVCHPKAILLREKDLSPEDYTKLAEQVLAVCKSCQTTCILHYFPESAVQLHAEKIHLPLPVLRTLSAEQKAKFQVIGTSCHSVEDAKEAVRLGANYLTAGHIFQTDCKKGLAPRGLDFLKAVCQSVSVPVYAIGGISPERFPAILKAGAKGGCLMSSLMQSEQPSAVFEKIRSGGESDALFT